MGASLLALALALAVYCLVSGYGAAWLLRSEWFTALLRERQETSVQAYQAYVIESGMSVRQVLEDPGWEGADPSTTIYSVVVGDWEEEGAVAVSMSQMSTDGSVSIYMEPLRCADGELYLTAAPNWAWLEGLVRIAALVLAAAVFCAVVVPYILHLLRRIEALSRETGALMAGDLSHSIRAPGRDELSRLGADIERLRLSVLERLEGEREAVGATGRLITGLSHDLRTPLTKLMGYLEILRYHKYDTQAEHDAFLRMALEKTEQIKGLTDQLFARCQASSPAEGFAGTPEAVDGAALLGQLLSEQCCDLQREGFDARPPVFGEDFTLYLRVEDVVRVFDNLFSNLRKYADPACPVDIRAELDPETVRLELENRILTASGGGDSHGCGLPTMRELMERGGGRLETERTGETYRTVLLFPKCKNL